MRMTMNKCPYLIIGNSVAAVGAVAGIREADVKHPITIVAKEVHHVYSRPLISYLLGGKVDEAGMWYRPADFYEKNNLCPLLGVEVKRVNTETRCVETTDGGVMGFEKLLIASGGVPIMPRDVVGTDAAGVFTFTTWGDTQNIKSFIEKNAVKRAVVVGGGLIGLKSLEALIALGIKTTLVELADRILSATFDETASELAQNILEKAGVNVCCGTAVTRFNQQDASVTGVTLADGTDIPCSLVIFAIGVNPNTQLVNGSTIEVDRGILVDNSLQTSVEGIYAAGDVAQAVDLISGERRCIPIFPNAYRQGFIAGNNMAGGKRIYEGSLAMNAVDIGDVPTISVGVTGTDRSDYEVLSSIDKDKPCYKKIVLKDDKIIGAIFFGQINRAGIITGLIKDKMNVSDYKGMLLREDFGLIFLPQTYRKKMLSGREESVLGVL